MTEFLGTDGGQIAGEVTGLTVAAEEVIAAPRCTCSKLSPMDRSVRSVSSCVPGQRR